jgi:putative component of toxin-antitoxin plasmid stabilization module
VKNAARARRLFPLNPQLPSKPAIDPYRISAIFYRLVDFMPQIQLVFFRDANGIAPAWEWLKDLRTKNPKAYAKCAVRIRRLASMGHELRRPEADFLRDGIYELRARLGMVNYRVFYFFHGRHVAVLASAITKENEIPAVDIKRALERKRVFVANPAAHTFIGDIENA